MLQALCGVEREETRNVGQVSECYEQPPPSPKGTPYPVSSPKNFTWLWVSLGEIHIVGVQALSLRFVLPADTAETTRATKAESDLGASNLLQQPSKLNGEHVKRVGRLLLTNKSSLSSRTKLCCTSNETDYCVSICVSTISYQA